MHFCYTVVDCKFLIDREISIYLFQQTSAKLTFIL